ncbi:OmpA family protein [Anaeromyxobacter soli]|uniref:OmpA family protein n=1 Tax=Anaeromyxobacter soli TaxID=2922725 RepID=UPI001FB00B99|nr:OmpA family protein [Anaeromyxobacter sp. SG29]
MPKFEEAELLDTRDVMELDRVEARRPSRAPWVLLVLTLLAGTGVAGWLLYRLQLARDEAATAAQRLQGVRAELDDARAQRADLAQRLGQTEIEKQELTTAKAELSQDVQAKDEQIATLRGEFDELQEKMKAEIEKGNIRLSQEQGRIKVDMVDEILFDVGEASISTQGEEVLSRVGAVLARLADKRIQVSGHTDDLPISPRLADRFPTNWELSAARAITVVRFLEERAHVPGRRLVAAAHSQFDPISANKTASGRARNRRIEILLTPEIDPDRRATLAAAGNAAAAAPAAAPRKIAAATTPAPAPKRAAPATATAHKRAAASRTKR